MGKILETRKLYKDTIKEVTKDTDNWLSFLDSSSWNFKYDFDDQILIYAQRPDARACAELDEWNKKLRRWVNKGANGIFVFSKDENSQFPFRIVFDLSDTHNSNNTEYKLWTIKTEYENEIIDTLESNFGDIFSEDTEEKNKTLARAINITGFNLIEDNIQDYTQQMLNHKSETALDGLEESDIENLFKITAMASVSYMIMTRCGIDPKNEMDMQDFSYISYFNSQETVTVLGQAVSDIAEMALREIAKTVFILQKNENLKNRTIEEINKQIYANTIENEKGGVDYERDNIHKKRRLQYTEPSDGERGDSNREIRQNEIPLLKGTSESRIDNTSDEPEPKQTLNGNTENSNQESESNSRKYGEGAGNNRGDESQQSNELGSTNEQLEVHSRGDSNQRANLRLEVYNEENHTGFVVVDEKINQILATTTFLLQPNSEIVEFFNKEKDIQKRADYLKSIFNNDNTEISIDNSIFNYQKYENGVLFAQNEFESSISKDIEKAESFVKWEDLTYHYEAMILLHQLKDRYQKPIDETEQQNLIDENNKIEDFEFSQEFVDRFLQEGHQDLKFSIYKQFEECLSTKENIDFLKRMYGDGGSSATVRRSGIGEWHDAKGIKFNRGYFDKSAREQLFNWNYIAKRIEALIKLNRYLNPKELEEYPKWLDEQEKAKIMRESEKRLAREQEDTKDKQENELAKRVYEFVNPADIYNYSDDSKALNTDEQNIEIVKADINDNANVADYVKALQNVRDSLDSTDINRHEVEVLISILDKRVPHYEYHLGDSVYIGADEYEIASIDNNTVTLHDPSFPMFDKQMGLEEFERKIKENYSNEHLKVTETADSIENIELKETTEVIESSYKERITDETIEETVIVENERQINTEKPYKVGDIVYLESGKKYQINEINTDRDIINLQDLNILYPIFREENILTFENLYYNNERNKPKEELKVTIDSNLLKENPKPISSRSKIQDYILHPDVSESDRNNFEITDNELGIGTPREKFQRNIEAINVLKKCEQENRYATKEEQKTLSKYVGWGGLQQAFDENNESWSEQYKELKTILTDEEYEQARSSTLTAFYTPPVVIRTIYQALQNMGLKEANILEPSCGVGNFFGMLPNELQNCKMYGIEIDSITGRIAQQLYQKSTIAVQGYEKVDLPDSFFDVAVGNVPFGDFKIRDRRYDKYRLQIHDYFFAKTIDKVRPGGVIAFITSKGTMDKQNSEVRRYIAQRADLIGAIRLPSNTFTKNAGTEVTSDIIFLQKRENMTDIMPEWVNLDTDSNDITMNKYFVDNPQMILGQMEMKSTQYGYDSTCKPFDGIELSTLLNEAIENLDSEIDDFEYGDIEAEETNTIPADPNVKNFSFTVVDGKVYFRENSIMIEQNLPVTTTNRIKGMIELRDCVRELIDLQTEDFSEEQIKLAQGKLNRLYDNFVKKYGLINSRGNSLAFSDDSSYYLLCSLEILDSEGKFLRKADMFTKRTIKAYQEITHVDTANEALILSLAEKARVDLEYMSNLTDKTQEEIIKELKGAIFKLPMEDNKYVPADEYLSGNVREKLKLAESLVETHPEFQINVDELRKVQPPDLTATEIGIKLGATWIPTETIEQFVYELLGTPEHYKSAIRVRFSKLTSEWYLTQKNYDSSNVKSNKTYGTNRFNAYEIIEKTLNLKDIKVFDTIHHSDGTTERKFNAKETAIVQGRQEQIKQEFLDWIWKEPERRNMLVRLYNDRFNNIRPREYDGSHLNFVGMNPEIALRVHQNNAVAHGLYGKNTLLAHEVGAGKTFEMIAIAMESKRLGLCNKSLFVVPNHIIEQFASEFLQLYPSANIMVATKKDFATANRKKFCSRIATGDFDAVIIGHSQFEKIPMSKERQEHLIRNQINSILDAIDEAKRDKAENFTIKQMEKSKRKLEDRLAKLNKRDRKDDVVTFEQLGVDKLFVDEAHGFKNLFLYTKMHNVGGIAQTEAQKSSDLFMKCRYMDEITDGRGVVFATGTPVSNSMVELYTMQRYLQYDDLVKAGLENFDNWASIFGETITAVELDTTGSGYRAKTRFAKFHNLPELMSLFKQVADIKTAETLNLPTPEVVNHNIVVKPSQMQKDMVEDLGERAEEIRNGNVDPSEDNMLKITNEGRKLALDQRLQNDMLEDYAGSKVNVACENIYKIWEDNKAEKLTQLVFCDLSTPKQFEPVYDENGKYVFTDVYNDMRLKLMEKGIPREEIAFIHEADSETKKKELFSKVRKGEIRVLIGSTSKMGAGTNVQDKIIALHHLDCPWRPADLTQRNGRGVRQGNQNKQVHIYTYVTEQTFDAYLFQLVETKQKFISQIMTSKTPIRSAEDVDEKALSYGEIKALATGNPDILKKTQLDAEVSKLKLLKQNYLNQIYDLQDRITQSYPKRMREYEEKIKLYTEDKKHLEENTKPNDDGFSKMILKGIEYTKKEEAGNAILDLCSKKQSKEPEEIGEYRGFKLELGFDSMSKSFTLNIKHSVTLEIDLGADVYGNIKRIDNSFDDLDYNIKHYTENLEDVKRQLETAKVEVEKPFTKENELKEKMEELDKLNISLNINEKEKQVLDTSDSDELENNEKDRDQERE